MFKQTPIPSESDLRAALGDDYEDRWDHNRVTLWLQEKGWGHIAATFREHGIRGKDFFTITLSQLVDILPRPVTTYAERRRLLSEIRALGTPAADASPALKTPANISINTNVHHPSYQSSSSSAGVDLPSGGTPTSAQLPDTASPSTPLSLSRFDCALDYPKDSGYHSRHSAGVSSTSSSPSSSEFPLGLRSSGNRNSPTRPYSPKSAFSKIRLNLIHNHAPSTLTPSTTGPLISSRTSSMQYDAATFKPENDDRPKQSSASTLSAHRTPDKISKLWAAYSQWRSPGSSNRTNNSNNNNNKSNASIPSNSGVTITDHQSKRPPSALAQHRRQSDQRIQVTGDMETWYSLVVTDVREAEVAKELMLRRMQLQGHPSEYYFFHENGPTPDKPLDSQEILAICFIADYTATHRILVKPVSEFICKDVNNDYQQSRLAAPPPPPPPIVNQEFKPPIVDYRYLRSGQYENRGQQQQQPSPYGNSTFSMSTPELGHSPSNAYSPRYIDQTLKPPSPRSPGYPSTKLLDAYDTSGSIGVRLCDPPTPSNAEMPLEEPIPYDQPRKGSVPFIHEAPKPSRSAAARRSEPMLTQSTALWPTDSTPHPDQYSELSSIGESSPRPPAQLWAVPPSTVRKKNDDDEQRYWGERPPADVVCQNMDQYFDNHDLDKEIVVEQPSSRRYTKSIRVVAREASQKYRHKDTSIVRRKSTKLWGQRVVEVKPGLQSVKEQVSMSMTHCHDNRKPVQWIRGKYIGKGSFGRVYLAFNVATGEVIAVKQVEVGSKLNPNASEVEDALYQEIAMLQDLDHDHIVQYLGYGRDDAEGVVNIFLEYVSGGSISSRLALHGALEEPVVRHFTRQICLGIAYLHSKNILHRDIKAANILVEADGVCKISDFGLSKKNDYDEVYDQNSRMSLRGSVYWMAPEVVKNEPYSAKVDIWSLGCTVIEMFTGQRPWLTLNQIAALYSLGCQKHPDIPKNISDTAKDFIRQCFIVDPNKRPTAAALLRHPFCAPDPSFKFADYVDKGKI